MDRFNEISHANPAKGYSLIKTHKVVNSVRVIAGGRGTVTEILSIFARKCLYSEVLNIENNVKVTSEMFTLIT